MKKVPKEQIQELVTEGIAAFHQGESRTRAPTPLTHHGEYWLQGWDAAKHNADKADAGKTKCPCCGYLWAP